MADCIIISDLHLGASISQTDKLKNFIHKVRKHYKPKKLILAGDVFDSFNFNRLKSSHWEVLSEIRKASKRIEVIWIHGNHDGPADIISHLIGVDVYEKYVFNSGDKEICVVHGDQFDDFITKHKIITEIVTGIYFWIQKIDKNFRLSTFLKRSSKTFIRCVEKVRRRATEHAIACGHDIICCGHTHHAESNKNSIYFNSGSWAEKHNHFIIIRNGNVEVKEYIKNEKNS